MDISNVSSQANIVAANKPATPAKGHDSLAKEAEARQPSASVTARSEVITPEATQVDISV